MAFQDHFSGHADVYRAARPTYPDALFDWLAGQVPKRDVVWDAACGNGQASIALARRFDRVIATDPSAQQIASAEPHPCVDYRVETAERCSLANGSTSLVTVAQALHWFDHTRFYSEAQRVLRPRGVFAAWGYSDCRIGPAIDRIKDRLYVELTGRYWPPERALLDAGYRTLDFPFAEFATPKFVMETRWNIVEFLAYLRSWSATQRYVKANGEDPVSLVESDLRTAWGDPAAQRLVHWNFHLRCGRCML
ncbi:MAG: class I SAM-dependent methyltransferase [Rhodanobacteraceae bacterium]